MLKESIQSVTAFAPATCANVAVGFDILGFAIDQIGDEVTVTRRNDEQLLIHSIQATESITLDPRQNTATVGIARLCADLKLKAGFNIDIKKGIPLSSGLGGSAASAVAAMVAFNHFLMTPLSLPELARYALLGEEVASGAQHGDNIIPSLFGGLTLIRSVAPVEVISLPIPNVHCVLIHPHLQVSTKSARALLAKNITLSDHIQQSTNLAGFLTALYTNDMALLQRSLKDVIIEDQRAAFVPGFKKIQTAAIAAGAMGMSFSGSGPSLFAFAETKRIAEEVSQAMLAVLKAENVAADVWITTISKNAAHVIEAK